MTGVLRVIRACGALPTSHDPHRVQAELLEELAVLTRRIHLLGMLNTFSCHLPVGIARGVMVHAARFAGRRYFESFLSFEKIARVLGALRR
jgi:hypothetical protein